MSLKIAMTKELTSDFLSDILITAFDAAYGGCWYWAVPSEAAGDPWKIEDGLWQRVYIEEREGDEEGTYCVSHLVLADGLQRMVDAGRMDSDIMTAISELDAGYIDADIADAIVQWGLFGKLVYG